MKSIHKKRRQYFEKGHEFTIKKYSLRPRTFFHFDIENASIQYDDQLFGEVKQVTDNGILLNNVFFNKKQTELIKWDDIIRVYNYD